MFFGILTFFIVIGMTVFFGRGGAEPDDVPGSTTLIAYEPFSASYLPPRFVSPGFSLW